jgi:hypothetical protein
MSRGVSRTPNAFAENWQSFVLFAAVMTVGIVLMFAIVMVMERRRAPGDRVAPRKGVALCCEPSLLPHPRQVQTPPLSRFFCAA